MNTSFSVPRPAEVPMPAAVAARPRDQRGYPVPAVTPWTDAMPAFAHQSPARMLICLAQRRCSVCGTKMPPGPVYRPASDEKVELIAAALRHGGYVENIAPDREGPGHKACMIYSAIVCPYLTSPIARRKIEAHLDTDLGTATFPRGDPRGPSGAVVGYDHYSWQLKAVGLEIYYGQAVEILPYANGADLADKLRAEIASERGPVKVCPPYLLDDDASARQIALAMPPNGSSRDAAVHHQEQARKARRKTARVARRKNR